MIAKLVVWGSDRKEALGKLQAKLIEFNVRRRTKKEYTNNTFPLLDCRSRNQCWLPYQSC